MGHLVYRQLSEVIVLIVEYDALSLALRMAPRNDRKITRDTTVTGDQAIGSVTHFKSALSDSA
jgi:hypothetical protein